MVFIGEVGVLIYLKTSLARRAGARRSIRGRNAGCECWAASPTKLMFSFSQAVYILLFCSYVLMSLIHILLFCPYVLLSLIHILLSCSHV